MTDTKWLKELKVGDNVFLCDAKFKRLSKVEKITPKGFIGVCGSLFSPDTGKERGSDIWFMHWLEFADEENIEKYNKKMFVENVWKSLRKLNIEDISYEQALEIVKIFNIQIK